MIGLLVYSYFRQYQVCIPEPPQNCISKASFISRKIVRIPKVKVLDIDLTPVKTVEAQYFLIKHEYGVTAMK